MRDLGGASAAGEDGADDAGILVVDGGPRIMLPLGQSALLLVPVGEVGGNEGMVALSLFTRDPDALIERLEDRGASKLRGANEVTLAPAFTHGVHLHISRYD